jgi:hypothetical protein
MTGSSDLRLTRIALNNGSGHMPALGCGTLIPDAAETLAVTRDALSLPHSHSVCISTGERAGPTGSKRQCYLRQRRNFARYLESNGKSRGPR